MPSSPDSAPRDLIRRSFVRLEGMHRNPSSSHSFYAFMAMEGAVASYCLAALVILVRLVWGPEGPLSERVGVWIIAIAAVLIGWWTCRDIESSARTDELRAEFSLLHGSGRRREVLLGWAFLLSSFAALVGAFYVAKFW